MPYETIHDLPEAIQKHLPEHAKHIYQKAFNHAWEEYRDRESGTASREEIAHKVAWSAVKHKYRKNLQTSQWEPHEIQ